MNASRDTHDELRTAGLVSGELRIFPIANVLQFLAMSGVTGMLRLASGGERAMIWLDHGSIVAASVLSRVFENRVRTQPPIGGATDEEREALLTQRVSEVLTSVMSWPDGHFSFDGYRLAPSQHPRPRVDVAHALMMTAVHFDESNKAQSA